MMPCLKPEMPFPNQLFLRSMLGFERCKLFIDPCGFDEWTLNIGALFEGPRYVGIKTSTHQVIILLQTICRIGGGANWSHSSNENRW